MIKSVDIAVVGAGGAGTMAYLRAVLNHDDAVLFAGDATTKRKGRATWVGEVDNIPGMHDLKRPITSTTSSTLKWLKNHPDLSDVGTVIKGAVTSVERDGDGFLVHYREKKNASVVRAKYVVLATGLMDRQPLIGGTIEPIFPYANSGDAIYCVRCDGHRAIGKSLSIVGNNHDAVWIAAMMHERYGNANIRILGNGTTITPNDETRALANAYGFEFYSSPIAEVMGDPKGLGLSGFRLDDDTVVETNCSIISLGTIVYSEFLTSLGGDVDGSGRVVVGDKFETSVPNFFAVGDLVAGRKLQIYTAWDEAVDAADEINRRIRVARRAKRVAETVNA